MTNWSSRTVINSLITGNHESKIVRFFNSISMSSDKEIQERKIVTIMQKVKLIGSP